jgi:outer membrane protein
MTRALGALILLAAPLAAGERALTWEDCVAIAARNNPDLASSELSERAGRARYLGSFNGVMPSLSLSNGYSDSLGGSALRWQAQASAGIDLFNASSLWDIRSASAAWTQARASLRLASASLRRDLRTAFARLLYAQGIVEVSRSIRDLREKDSRLVSLRYDSGRESKGNMLNAKAQLLSAQADLDGAQRDLLTARGSLDRRLGLDSFEPVSASGTLEASGGAGGPCDFPALAALTPEVASAEAALRSAEAAFGQARSPLWPTLSMSYSRSLSDSSEFPSSHPGWSFSTLLKYPLFGSGPTAAYYASEAARKGLEKAREDLRSARNQAVTDLASAWAGYAAALDQARVQAALLEAARQRNDEADVRYASGLLSFDNWEIIVTDRVNSERRAISARLEAVVAEAAWERSLGKVLGQ